jgi:3,4-dihydroxy 2-butanone 4-phosphate synthase/GTP cyclohydrolase II
MDLSRYSEARMPTPHGEFRIHVYRTGRPADLGASALGGGVEEHVAMVMGDVTGDAGAAVLTRVHSSCFTGEVLGSQRCDCRAQLQAALARIAREGRAYALQDDGHDTVEANLQLGFDADLRSYDLAAGILRDLGVTSVRLMTNNPAKLEGLAAAGIPVAAHEPHWVDAHEHAADYLEVKKTKMGHIA